MPLLPFARQSKPGTDAAGYSGERLVNYFVRPSDGVSPGVLIGRSGLHPQTGLGGPVRALLDASGRLYAVADGRLWRLDATPVDLGLVNDDPKTSIAAGSGQVAVVSGGRYYLWDGATLASYGTGAVDTPVSVAWQDGYFIVAGIGNGRSDLFTISGLDDGKTFDGLDYAAAESNPDGIVAILSDHSQVMAFGLNSVESFYNSGAAAFPFEPNRSASIARGVKDARTIAQEDNAVFWVGPDNVVYRYGGGAPAVISTREIEETLGRATIAAAFTFTDRGHKFYCIRRESGSSLCYDITTGMWCERQTGEGPWIATCAVMSAGVQYVGTSTGTVCTISSAVFTDDGAEFAAEAVSVPVVQGGALFPISRLYLMIGMGDIALPDETMTTELYDADGDVLVDADGVVLMVQADDEPNGRVILQTSKDGRTWSLEKWRPLGRKGEYGKRVMWHALGQFRRFQVRIKITDPVRRDIYGVSYE